MLLQLYMPLGNITMLNSTPCMNYMFVYTVSYFSILFYPLKRGLASVAYNRCLQHILLSELLSFRMFLIFRKETTFFILQSMFQHSYVIFCCKCLIVVHFNFQCILDYVIELCHKLNINNFNIVVHWEQTLCACQL